MVTIQGKLLGPRHVELSEPVPPGEDSIQVPLVQSLNGESDDAGLLTRNPSFDFLRDEPDLYE
jgi:hypothetical protein